ncbi:MAG: hypothetical protein IJ375_01820 [Oscillospiraceae bacterium]|nr:hypothetical protein [Oscillospiraceae bacterium]
MAVQQSFRTAFNGFNREDVVHYIEFLNAKHIAEVNQLTSELEFLRGKLAESQAAAAPDQKEKEVAPLIEQQAARVRELFDEKNELAKQLETALADKKAAEEQLSAALAEKCRAAANLESALEQQDSFKSRMEEELEAYRRAERTERIARERAEQMYRQANGVLADATGKVDEAAGQIGDLAGRVMEQLQELQSAVANSKQALRDAAATMYTIRPDTEE